jgi:hypothetical protein
MVGIALGEGVGVPVGVAVGVGVGVAVGVGVGRTVGVGVGVGRGRGFASTPGGDAKTNTAKATAKRLARTRCIGTCSGPMGSASNRQTTSVSQGTPEPAEIRGGMM